MDPKDDIRDAQDVASVDEDDYYSSGDEEEEDDDDDDVDEEAEDDYSDEEDDTGDQSVKNYSNDVLASRAQNPPPPQKRYPRGDVYWPKRWMALIDKALANIHNDEDIKREIEEEKWRIWREWQMSD